MKAKSFALIISATLLCAVALAGTASDIDNCCFVDRQCITNQDWVNGYHAYENNQCVATSGSQPSGGAPAPIDNCCFVDRQCQTDQDWTDGYYAYQNNQCQVPAGSQTPTSSQPVSGAPAQIDNCCFVDRQCTTELDWMGGWHAYQNNQCGAPGQSQAVTSSQPGSGVILRTASGIVMGYPSGRGILPSTGPSILPGPGQSVFTNNCCQDSWQCNSDQDLAAGYAAFQNGLDCGLPGLISIVGEPDFVSYYLQALQLLKNRLPQRYNYVLNGLDKIEQRQEVSGRFVISGGRRTFFLRWDGPADEVYGAGWETREPSVLVHEACHVHRANAGYAISECDHGAWTREEVFCRSMGLEVLIELDAAPHVIEWTRENLAETRTGRPGIEHVTYGGRCQA
ncbi:MAG: hypothetical protein OXG78_06990 [Chloroflexi bacterium]|nr:hypothetical protein [Chloroflexota bacterium]